MTKQFNAWKILEMKGVNTPYKQYAVVDAEGFMIASYISEREARLICKTPKLLELLQAIHDANLIADVDPLAHSAIGDLINERVNND